MDVSSHLAWLQCAVRTSLHTPTSHPGAGVARIFSRPPFGLSTNGTMPSCGAMMVTFAKLDNSSGISELSPSIPSRTPLLSDLKLMQDPSEPKRSQGIRRLSTSSKEALETMGDFLRKCPLDDYLDKHPLFEDGLRNGWDHVETPNGDFEPLTTAKFYPYHRRVMGYPMDFGLDPDLQEALSPSDVEG